MEHDTFMYFVTWRRMLQLLLHALGEDPDRIATFLDAFDQTCCVTYDTFNNKTVRFNFAGAETYHALTHAVIGVLKIRGHHGLSVEDVQPLCEEETEISRSHLAVLRMQLMSLHTSTTSPHPTQ